MAENRPAQKRLPQWFRMPNPVGPSQDTTQRTLKSLGLNTVCNEARCPNLGECFAHKTATFLILGRVCTRSCRYCSVHKGRPLPLDPEEPKRVAMAAEAFGMEYLVITSVTRDDLPDQGAMQFVSTIREVRKRLPRAKVEVLTPDFRGEGNLVRLILAEGPDVFTHNLETVPRLYPRVRPGASFEGSLKVFKAAKEANPKALIKTGLMLGLGEGLNEAMDALQRAKRAGVEVVTLGQYLQPTKAQIPVEEFFSPDVFQEIARRAREEFQFRAVIAGPLVRSSYRAWEVLESKSGASLDPAFWSP